MAVLYITRHGETQWNVERRMQGWNNSPLTELGEMQAHWLKERLRQVEFSGIHSSPLERAYETASIIRDKRNIDIIKSEDLKEISLGPWEGRTMEEIEKSHKEESDNFWKRPHLYVPIGGESFYQVQERVERFLENILKEYNNPEDNVLIVTHGVALKALMLYFHKRGLEELWTPPFMNQTSLTVVEVNGDKHHILMEGDTSHYREDYLE